MPKNDDDALSWDGDDDPTLAPQASGPDVSTSLTPPATQPTVPPAYSAPALEGEIRAARSPGSEAVAAPERAQSSSQDSLHKAEGMSSAALVTWGILGGIYLLSTIGWLVGGLRLGTYAQFLVAPAGFQVSLWLAVAAPAAWFATVAVVARRSKMWVRLVWLFAGVLILLPWPFVMMGAVGV